MHLSYFYSILYKLMELFGRSTNCTMLDHITIYISTPITHFYQFIEAPLIDVQYFAQETLAGLNNLLFKLYLRDAKYLTPLEMKTICGYTFFRRSYHDFGLITFIWLIYSFLLCGIGLKNNSIIIKKKYSQFLIEDLKK